MSFNVHKIREDFPILKRRVNGRPLIYLDNAATTHKPRQVLDAVRTHLEQSNANVHRGIHTLAEEATAAYEKARETVANFINAFDPHEIVFTRNATEAINLVAQSWGRANIKEGDEILLTQMEHHSNLVPWQMLAKEKGAVLKFIPIDTEGTLALDTLPTLVTPRTRLLGIVYISNTLGKINPVGHIIRELRGKYPGLKFLVDGAQAVPHMPVDVQRLDADFLVFSGHKMLAPMGIGVLWAKRELLEEMPPFLGGGHMIKEVSFEESSWNDVPWKFEAGTAYVEGAIGLEAAIAYLERIGMTEVRDHERVLTERLFSGMEELKKTFPLRIFSPPYSELRRGVISFVAEGVHPHDLASLLDEEGIAVRAGHHCTMPLHKLLGVPATCRASVYVYNTEEEIDRFLDVLAHAIKRLKG